VQRTTGIDSIEIDNQVVYMTNTVSKEAASVGASHATLSGATHHHVSLNGANIHYVRAGASGPPLLLVHGFPETWWTFHKVIPRLALHHRVVAVDLRGFGDSEIAAEGHDSSVAANDLKALIDHLALGPVHVLAQDISGGAVFRLATEHPDLVASLTAVEMGLAGYGLEALADVSKGGAWHIGVIATPGIPDLLLKDRELRFLQDFAFSAMLVDRGALDRADYDELVRTWSRPGAWNGAAGLYRSMLKEGDELRKIASATPLTMPVMAIGGANGNFTKNTMAKVSASEIQSQEVSGVGHYVALEAPEKLADLLSRFVAGVAASQ
jgi:pimeloyl-ACP methyl ester carboxylesterase